MDRSKTNMKGRCQSGQRRIQLPPTDVANSNCPYRLYSHLNSTPKPNRKRSYDFMIKKKLLQNREIHTSHFWIVLPLFNNDFSYNILTLIFYGLVEQQTFFVKLLKTYERKQDQSFTPVACIVSCGFNLGTGCAKQEYSMVIIRKQRVNEYPIKEIILYVKISLRSWY